MQMESKLVYISFGESWIIKLLVGMLLSIEPTVKPRTDWHRFGMKS